jgi:hypothetical protein
MLPINAGSAIKISFYANLFTSLIGFVCGVLLELAFPFGILVTYAVGPLYIWWYLKNKAEPGWVAVLVIGSFIVGGLGFYAFDALSHFNYSLAVIACFILFALPSFGLSLFIEGKIAVRYFSGRKLWKAVAIGNILSYVLVVGLSAHFVDLNRIMDRASWASRSKGTLRSIGSSQLAYQGTNEQRNFGSFKALKDNMYIAEGYNLGNMIENYSMTWEVHNLPADDSEDSQQGAVHSFTVIAWPLRGAPPNLHTFGITEDQVVREYIPKNGNQIDHVQSWDPIL